MKRKIILILLIVVIITSGIVFENKTSFISRYFISKQIKALENQVQQIKHLETTDISECRVVPLGHTPCEAPRDYIVYSIKNTNESKLLELVNEIGELDKKRNNLDRFELPCMMPLPVKVEPELVSGMCVIKK